MIRLSRGRVITKNSHVLKSHGTDPIKTTWSCLGSTLQEEHWYSELLLFLWARSLTCMSHKPVTLYFLFVLGDNQFPAPRLLFFNLSPFFPPVSLNAHLLPVSLPPPSHEGLYFLKFRNKTAAWADLPRRQRELSEKPTLTSILSSLLTLSFCSFLRPRRTSKLCGRSGGLVAWWTSEDIEKHSNSHPHRWNCARACAGKQKPVRGKAWWDIFCCSQSHLSHRSGWMCHSGAC